MLTSHIMIKVPIKMYIHRKYVNVKRKIASNILISIGVNISLPRNSSHPWPKIPLCLIFSSRAVSREMSFFERGWTKSSQVQRPILTFLNSRPITQVQIKHNFDDYLRITVATKLVLDKKSPITFHKTEHLFSEPLTVLVTWIQSNFCVKNSDFILFVQAGKVRSKVANWETKQQNCGMKPTSLCRIKNRTQMIRLGKYEVLW